MAKPFWSGFRSVARPGPRVFAPQGLVTLEKLGRGLGTSRFEGEDRAATEGGVMLLDTEQWHAGSRSVMFNKQPEIVTRIRATPPGRGI